MKKQLLSAFWKEGKMGFRRLSDNPEEGEEVNLKSTCGADAFYGI